MSPDPSNTGGVPYVETNRAPAMYIGVCGPGMFVIGTFAIGARALGQPRREQGPGAEAEERAGQELGVLDERPGTDQLPIAFARTVDS